MATINSYADLKTYLDSILTANQEMADTQRAPHGAFWDNLSYNDFVNGNVPKVAGGTIPILVKGKSAQSNIILALRGQGPLFDPNTGRYGQMPADGGTLLTEAQIKPIADWIDAGCPQ